MITRLLITDTETGGLDPSVHPCLEVALVVFDIPTLSVIESFSTLIASDTNEAEAVNRISVGALSQGREASQAWKIIDRYVDTAATHHEAALVAHRASFDRSFYPERIAKRLPWVCSKYDVSWPLSKYGDGLVHVALAHGIGVIDAHRALTDCQTLARLFRRVGEMGHDVGGMIHHALMPRKTFRAVVSFDEREKAKALGFEWDGARKIWHRRLAIEDATTKEWPFKLEEVT